MPDALTLTLSHRERELFRRRFCLEQGTYSPSHTCRTGAFSPIIRAEPERFHPLFHVERGRFLPLFHIERERFLPLPWGEGRGEGLRAQRSYFSDPTSALRLSSNDTTRLHTSLPNFWKSASWFFHSF